MQKDNIVIFSFIGGFEKIKKIIKVIKQKKKETLSPDQKVKKVVKIII